MKSSKIKIENQVVKQTRRGVALISLLASSLCWMPVFAGAVTSDLEPTLAEICNEEVLEREDRIADLVEFYQRTKLDSIEVNAVIVANSEFEACLNAGLEAWLSDYFGKLQNMQDCKETLDSRFESMYNVIAQTTRVEVETIHDQEYVQCLSWGFANWAKDFTKRFYERYECPQVCWPE